MADKRKLIFYDGQKSGVLWDETTPGLWNYFSDAPVTPTQDFYKLVPTIYRGINIISNAVATMPFSIYKGNKEVDSSAEWKNKIHYLPHPRKTIGLLSSSLDLTGRAYLHKAKNQARLVSEWRYYSPLSMEPEYTPDKSELIGFKRNNQTVPVEEVLYFWLQDPFVELGPPSAYPVQAAFSAAGVLRNLADFVALYFKRGAIRPILVSVKGGPSQVERERMEGWFNTLMGGLKNAFHWKIFEADTVDFKQIGDGLSELRDVELTESQRQDVAVAIGVPYSILFPDAANYATAHQDVLSMYHNTIEPRCELIAEVMNEQGLKDDGYTLEFSPESLDIYQEDENKRSQALVNYVNAGYELLMASDILGIDLTDEQRAEMEAQKKAKEERANAMADLAKQGANQQPPNQEQQPPPNNQPPQLQDNQQKAELDRWKRKAIKAAKAGKTPAVEFVSDIIPPVIQAAIGGALEACNNAEDVHKVFQSTWIGYP